MKKQFFVIAFFAILLFGCATSANYKRLMNGWVGHNAGHLVEKWGVPQSSYRLSNGGWVLEYYKHRNMQFGGIPYTERQTTRHSGTVSAHSFGRSSIDGDYSGTSTTYVQKRTPPYNINLWCKTRFTVNPQGIIIRANWQGNDCTALPPK